MTQKNIDKIIDRSQHGLLTVIGRYTYRADPHTGVIYRCKTDDVGREWISNDGRIFSGWEEVIA